MSCRASPLTGGKGGGYRTASLPPSLCPTLVTTPLVLQTFCLAIPEVQMQQFIHQFLEGGHIVSAITLKFVHCPPSTFSQVSVLNGAQLGLPS